MRSGLSIFSFLITLMLVGCSTNYRPKFAVSEEDVVSELNQMIECEEIEITGFRQQFEDTLISRLAAHFTNVKNLSKDKDSLELFQRQIARKLKHLLRDSAQFNTISIWFMYRKGDWFKSENRPVVYHYFSVSSL